MLAKLEVHDLFLSFGGIEALKDISFSINDKEIFSIIGPNGAGKSSLLNCINGLYHPQKGKIVFKQTDITNWSADKIAKFGIGRTFQNLELFKGMSVLDNLMLGRHNHLKYGILPSIIWVGRTSREEITSRVKVEKIIDLLEIQSVRKKAVGTLPYGLQKRVELGRALAVDPEIMLLDEPMAGMNEEEREDMARFVLDINEEMDKTIILIEHDMSVVMDISDRIMALDFGEKIADGTPEQIQNNSDVLNSYIGGKEKGQVA
ncbi:MAG: ABC transporter ATP-binding protein [Epsilonproteobacteria bacterium]|nr:ABC transporter ATP-binding protein [Campylobacterota bacterium]